MAGRHGAHIPLAAHAVAVLPDGFHADAREHVAFFAGIAAGHGLGMVTWPGVPFVGGVAGVARIFGGHVQISARLLEVVIAVRPFAGGQPVVRLELIEVLLIHSVR
ncbi:hypothetical protein D9M68_482900 [compost metagenome]